MTGSIQVRISKKLNEYLQNEAKSKELSKGKLIELRFKQELPFLITEKIKPKKNVKQ